jgi:tetratricopeptide (TPR) repeat protein
MGSLAARALAKEIISRVCVVALLPGAAASEVQPDHCLWIMTPGAPAPSSPGEPSPVLLLSPRVDPTELGQVRVTLVPMEYKNIARTLTTLASILPLEAHTVALETTAQFRAQDAFEHAMCRPANDLPGKIADYSRALHYHPYYAEAFARRGGARIALGELDAGIADCDEAIRLAPDQAEAFYNRARAHSRREDYRAAIADYTAALERDPALVQAYLNRGASQVYLRDYAAAIADYSHVLALDPTLAEAHFNRSLSYAEAGDFEGAVRDYGKALTLNLDHAASSRPSEGDTGQTLAYLERLLRRFPDHPAAATIRAEMARLALKGAE